ncbi:unnamed protein product [Ceutorhynchus assimilis]|uniref:ASCH domain-containing protein n=1 Tax=Ceutorhynchus assimilis TaxID=467358 RepID=A0A9P0GX60_9CUCU|nr:unnamed protein product [Ceutorhynchus assimilis]
MKKVEALHKNLQKESELKSSASVLAQKNKSNNELAELLVQMRHKKPKEKEDLGEEDEKMPIIKYNTKMLDEVAPFTDQGLCLSMHQPYASLLVAGVKMDEGRVWPTTHRGRLWIAAAAKEPDEEEVLALENYYREFYKDDMLKFPKEYPTGCLLGCVTVEDCLDQEAYKETYGREASSPYMLVCSNPIILPVFYPISGKNKIYPLDKEIHKYAKIALQYSQY